MKNDRHREISATAMRCSCLLTGAVLALTSLLSCEPEPLDVDDLEIPDRRIVVNSMILSDGSVAVQLTSSMNALEANDETNPRDLIARVAINDAEVTLTLDSTSHRLELLENGIYHGVGIHLVPGKKCALDVRSKSLGQVNATTIIEDPVAFGSVTVVPFLNEHNEYWAQVSYSIIDPSTPNYYVITVRKLKGEGDLDGLLLPEAYTRTVHDNTFNGTTFSESFIATHKDLHPGDTLEVLLSSVSLEYFRYVSLRLENQLELAEIFSEPVYYPTNIRGGQGFFSLHIPDVKVIVLQ